MKRTYTTTELIKAVHCCYDFKKAQCGLCPLFGDNPCGKNLTKALAEQAEKAQEAQEGKETASPTNEQFKIDPASNRPVGATAKDFLSQGFFLTKRIMNLQEELRFLQDTIDIGSPVLDPIGGGAGTNSFGTNKQIRQADRIIDLEAEIKEECARMVQTSRRIREAINLVESPQAQLVLRLRYIFDKTYPDIAEDLDLSVKQVRLIHTKALEEIEKKYKKI